MSESTQPDKAATPVETEVDLAYRALLDHATSCRRCLVNWRECPTRRALSAMLREATT